MSSDMQISTMMAKKEDSRERDSKKIIICIQPAAAVSHLCLYAIYCMLHQTVEFFPFVFSGLRWYFCLAEDVSGWTRSATLRGGQVSKKHESKTL